MDRDGLELLTYAADDADWQVRLAAVHFIGKVGLPAAPVLGAVALREPCPHVRLLALLWLSRLGATGDSFFRATATSEDVAELARMPERYAPGLMGKPLAIDVPDEMNAEFFNGGTDLRVCASSEHAGRRRLRRELPGAARTESHEVVVTPEVPLAARKDLPATAARSLQGTSGVAESASSGVVGVATGGDAGAGLKGAGRERREDGLDKILSEPLPETLPRGEPWPPAAVGAATQPHYEAMRARVVVSADVKATTGGKPESLPAGPSAPPSWPSEPAVAEFAPDAGTGRPEYDALPALIAQLSAAEPRRRARAADELGKRGGAAAEAAPALRGALSDRDRRVRASAALALGSVGGGLNGSVAALKLALEDKDEDVRFSAAIALERIKRPH